jgi:hypothetical protein
MNLNQAFKKSILRYLNGASNKELDKVMDEPFEFTLEALEELAEEVLSEKTQAKESKKSKNKKDKVEEKEEDGE